MPDGLSHGLWGNPTYCTLLFRILYAQGKKLYCNGFIIKVKEWRQHGLITVCSWVENPTPTFNWVFEYQPIALEILSHPRRYEREENNLLTDKICP